MHDLIATVLLGLLEGLTEFLPVSSTGHLLLAEHFLPARSDVFNTVIQSGAVCAVWVLFGGRVKALLTSLHAPETRDYLLKLGVAFGMTAAFGLVLKKAHFKLPETTAPVAWATLVGGILFVVTEWRLGARPGPKGDAQAVPLTWPQAVAMGVGQLLAAVFPGASRSGSTILLALILGARRPEAAAFSFLLGIPTLLAAGAVEVLGAVKDNAPHEAWGTIALGALVAAVTAFGVVRWLLGYVQHHTFMVFGWYRIVLGALMLAFA